MNSTRLDILGCFFMLLGAAAWAAEPSGPYQEVLQYQFGQPRAALAPLEAEIHAARPEQFPAFEARLVATLGVAEATADCKDWACRQLRYVGSERCVPALVPLLADERLNTVARFALQSIPGPGVDAALRTALGTLHGPQRAGVLQTIGARRDRQAVPLLAPLAGDKDAAVAEMALYALGQIGGPEALAAIQKAPVPDRLRRYRSHARMRCAEALAAAGQQAEATAIYQSELRDAGDVVVKLAALQGLAATDKVQAAPAITAALKADDKRLARAAAQLACAPGQAGVLRAALAELSAFSGDVQLTLLAATDDPAARPAVQAAATGGDEAIRLSAIATLGRIGDSSAIDSLVIVAATEQGALQAAARASLEKVRTKDADAHLIGIVEFGSRRARTEAIRALASRGAACALPALLKLAAGDDKAVQTPAVEALGSLADAAALPDLLKLLAAAPDAPQREAVARALAAMSRRVDDKAAAADIVCQALARETGAETRVALVQLLVRFPSPRALEALRAALKGKDEAVQDAAIRGLAGWPDPEALADVLAIARSAPRPAYKVLALRGVVRLAALPSKRPADQTAAMLAEALSLASRADEKRLVLGALADVQHPRALAAALGCLTDKEIELEAATAVVHIAQALQGSQPEAAQAALRQVRQECQSPAAKQLAEASLSTVELGANIAAQGTATSPDGWKKDGQAGGPQAAIDNDPKTYWDKEDKKDLYRLVVTFKQPERLAAISIVGYAHHKYAPKTFEILGDGKLIKRVENAEYADNLLVVSFDPLSCTSVELRITGYYGGSPAIRELGIYRPAAGK